MGGRSAHDVAIDDIEFGDGGFQELCSHLTALSHEACAATMWVAEPVITVTRAARAPTRARSGRSAVHDAHAPIIDVQGVGTDLSDHRFEALAERSAPGDDLDGPGGVDGYLTPSFGPSPLSRGKDHAGTDRFAVRPSPLAFLLQRVPADRRHHLFE